MTEEQLQEVEAHACVLEIDDFLEAPFRNECEQLIPDILEIQPEECAEAFIYLKQNFDISQSG